jgi:hypothetical protein
VTTTDCVERISNIPLRLPATVCPAAFASSVLRQPSSQSRPSASFGYDPDLAAAIDLLACPALPRDRRVMAELA